MRIGRVTSVLAIAAVIVAACGSDAAPRSPMPPAALGANGIAVADPYRFPPRVQGPSPSPTPGPWPPTAEWRTYASAFFRYQISYPPTWKVDQGDANFADEIDAGELPWLFVRRGVADSAATTVREAVGKDLLIEQRDDRAELISARTISLPGGYEGMYLLYHGRIRLGPVTVQRIIVAKGLVFYYFSLYGPPPTEASDIDLFRQIYETWTAI